MLSQWEQVARLLRRTGFGTTGKAVDSAVRAGAEQQVAQILDADPTTDAGVRATPTPKLAPIPRLGKSPSAADRNAIRKLAADQAQAMTAWWIRRMVNAEQPFVEKLTFCWHNHFATSQSKVRHAGWMLAQNEKLRTLGRGDFHALAYAMLTDAAMLRWLDGEKNTSKAPNENLAREFMELFTLGHGDAYTESDVRQGARALTGWRINPDGTTFVSRKLHDTGTKTILGVTGNLNAAGYCDAVLAQPGSARYVASRAWSQLASDAAPPSALVDRMVKAYGSRRDIAAMLKLMLSAPEFLAAQGSIVINPVEWLIGAVRTLQVPIRTDADAIKLVNVLEQLGQRPFYPPSVGGWPSGQAWLSTAAADVRIRAAGTFAKSADLSALDGGAPSRLDAVAYLLGIRSWSAGSAAALRTVASNPHNLVSLALNTPEYLVH